MVTVPAQLQEVDQGRKIGQRNRPPPTYMEFYERTLVSRPRQPYMTVIRETPQSLERREDLKVVHRHLVKMDFDRKRKSEMVSFINRFMNSRTSK